MGHLLPCLVVGGAADGRAVEAAPAALWLLPGLWAILFGLGLLASRPVLPRGGRVGRPVLPAGRPGVGRVVGHATPPFSPWVMGLPFGLGQLAGAAVLYWTLEREPMADG